MIHHASVGVTDYEKSKELYASMLAPLGYTVGADMPEYTVAGFSDGEGIDFWVGQKEHIGDGSHVAFVAKDQKAVEDFHAAALKAGASDNGAPGYRTEYSPGYYAAFIHDFDGNNIEAVWQDPSKA